MTSAPQALNPKESAPQPNHLEQELFDQVLQFYDLPSIYDTTTQLSAEERQLAKLRAAEAIGANLDDLIIKNLEARNLLQPDSFIKILSPLRGATSLEAGFENPDTRNGMLELKTSGDVANVNIVNIGIKRHGPKAAIYFPLSQEGINLEPDDFIVIKDMGVATGGTASELVELAVQHGIDPRRIRVAGAVGTDMAREIIALKIVECTKSFAGGEITIEEAREQVIFAVKGQMPIERGEHNDNNPSMDYYLDTLVQPDGKKIRVNAQDWGDEANGSMKNFWLDATMRQISRYIQRLDKVTLAYNGKGLSPEEKQALINHYIDASINP